MQNDDSAERDIALINAVRADLLSISLEGDDTRSFVERCADARPVNPLEINSRRVRLAAAAVEAERQVKVKRCLGTRACRQRKAGKGE